MWNRLFNIHQRLKYVIIIRVSILSFSVQVINISPVKRYTKNDLNFQILWRHGLKIIGHGKPVITACPMLQGETPVDPQGFVVAGFVLLLLEKHRT